MQVVLDGERFETALIQMTRPGGMTIRVMTLRVDEREPAQEEREFAILVRPDEQMPMIGQ